MVHQRELNANVQSNQRKWQKILYEHQGVPDNYTDDTFLDELRTNFNTRTYKFWDVVWESGIVTQQISSICIFVVVFIYMSEKWWDPVNVVITSSLLTLIGYVLNDIIDHGLFRKEAGRSRLDDLKSATVFYLFGFGLSPILHTLTESISTDTIYAMTTVMLLFNIFCHDYGTGGGAIVSTALSLNSAMFASVCLASRLPTNMHTFSMVTLAVEVFALFPVLRRRLKKFYPKSHTAVTIILCLVATSLTCSVSSVGTVLFLLLHLIITVLCPVWLIKLQPLKDTVHGPWDEAEINY